MALGNAWSLKSNYRCVKPLVFTHNERSAAISHLPRTDALCSFARPASAARLHGKTTNAEGPRWLLSIPSSSRIHSNRQTRPKTGPEAFGVKKSQAGRQSVGERHIRRPQGRWRDCIISSSGSISGIGSMRCNGSIHSIDCSSSAGIGSISSSDGIDPIGSNGRIDSIRKTCS